VAQTVRGSLLFGLPLQLAFSTPTAQRLPLRKSLINPFGDPEMASNQPRATRDSSDKSSAKPEDNTRGSQSAQEDQGSSKGHAPGSAERSRSQQDQSGQKSHSKSRQGGS
jgi:hypothetical protein